MHIEVVYALADEQALIALEVNDGTTLETAIHRSGLLQRFPEIDLRVNSVGVFGRRRPLDSVLNAGDRVEIYRLLSIDPKLARQRRAEAIKKPLRRQPHDF